MRDCINHYCDSETSCGLIWDGLVRISDLIWSSAASLGASSPGHSGSGVGKGRRVSGIWIPPPIPLWLPWDWAVRFLPISKKQNWARMSTNIEKTRAKGNGIITNVISANQHFSSAFLIRIFKFQRCCCKLFFPFPACRQSTPESLLAGYSAAWPPAFLFLSFSTLRSSSSKRTDIIVPSKLNKALPLK